MLAYEQNKLGSTQCGKGVFYWGKRTYIMGVVNLSPDSFSGDGLRDADAAVTRAKQMAEEGVDIIDVGGESTRPSSAPISISEELHRVIPVVEKLSHEVSLPLSIDTYKPEVARHALDAGASMINDIWGLKREPRLAELAAQRGVPIILMSNQRDSPPCQDIISTIISDLQRAIKQALASGVSWENIIIDPGIGFGKTQEQNLEILRRLEELKTLGRPILLGSSRKSVIGWVLDLSPEQRSEGMAFIPPADRRLEGTAATLAIGIAKGADIVRVHDVKQMVRVCQMSDAIIRGIDFAKGKKGGEGYKTNSIEFAAKPQMKGLRTTAYLCLGSNLGEREKNLAQALTLLSQKANLDKVSSIYETEPVGYKEQPLFLNLVCRITTDLNAEELLQLAKDIESKMGRIPGFPNSPRPIDIDILFYGDMVIKTQNLTIPHPRLAERAFVLIPLTEIAPELVHPELGKSVAELADSVKGYNGVRKWQCVK